MNTVMDSSNRTLAISPHASFLVQAPAGSGKTELLIQRILALLAIVDEPEEILALTFTRKAAAEMRERVFKALQLAQQVEPEAAHAKATWRLAVAVLQQSKDKAWRLLDYPARLRIMTIDAFASGLARQLPVLSGFGQSPSTADHAEPMYQAAVESILTFSQQKNAPAPLKQAMDTLILHQACNMEKLQALLCNMLARREQWLPDVMGNHADMVMFRQHIEASLDAVMQHSLDEAYAGLPDDIKGALPALASFAEVQLSEAQSKDAALLTAVQGLQRFPQPEVNLMAQWQALVHLLLVKGKAQARKTVTKAVGFPAATAGDGFQAKKEAMLDVLAVLQADDALCLQLDGIRSLPKQSTFDDEAWHVLEALFVVLKMLAAQLWQTFEQHKKVDFVEVMLRAKQALGQVNALGEMVPSEALLRLDYQIKHILVDEFQDTSTLQIDLLSRLTAGWADDGRSLFMVGDPMQSIYRFRKAEVSLFLKAAQGELPNHQQLPPVTSLKLSQNFRSSPDIVDWVNRAFAHIFPAQDDALAGAIQYAPSQAFKQDAGVVKLHVFQRKDDGQEAQAMLEVVKQALAGEKSVGILARNRGHLKALMALFQHENVPFRALDMLLLAKQPEIIDLRSLTCALLHPCDSVAWASLLRAPTTGLSLTTLHHIFSSKPDSAWQAIQAYVQNSEDDSDVLVQQRVQDFVQALRPAMEQQGKIGVRTLIESTWLRLATPAILNKNQLANADVYFQLLEKMEEDGRLEINQLDQRLSKLYAKPESQSQAGQVELMTMHGAKGLQWDTVILPGLGKSPRAADKDVLVQTEVFTDQGQQLLMSPLPQQSDDSEKEKVYALIRSFEQQRDTLEVARLLYVACTRAESALHLFGHVQGDSALPQASSLLALLWQDEACFGASVQHYEALAVAPESEQPSAKYPPAQRLPASFQAQPAKLSIRPTSHEQPLHIKAAQLEFSWAGASAKAVGIAIHAALQQIGDRGIETWGGQQQAAAMTLMQGMLLKEGISQEHLKPALQRCKKALDISLKSDRARWILSQEHAQQHNEWALTYVADSKCKHIVVDRSFIDSDGTRWIIDYKTGGHEGADLAAFLDQELIRYTQDTPQLPNYVKALRALEPEREIKAALYFPMVDGWRVWQG